MQARIIDQLEKRLLKPKSFFQKVLAGLRDIVIMVGGIIVGRGLAF
jgi:hypothetical protein